MKTIPIFSAEAVLPTSAIELSPSADGGAIASDSTDAPMVFAEAFAKALHQEGQGTAADPVAFKPSGKSVDFRARSTPSSPDSEPAPRPSATTAEPPAKVPPSSHAPAETESPRLALPRNHKVARAEFTPPPLARAEVPTMSPTVPHRGPVPVDSATSEENDPTTIPAENDPAPSASAPVPSSAADPNLDFGTGASLPLPSHPTATAAAAPAPPESDSGATAPASEVCDPCVPRLELAAPPRNQSPKSLAHSAQLLPRPSVQRESPVLPAESAVSDSAQSAWNSSPAASIPIGSWDESHVDPAIPQLGRELTSKRSEPIPPRSELPEEPTQAAFPMTDAMPLSSTKRTGLAGGATEVSDLDQRPTGSPVAIGALELPQTEFLVPQDSEDGSVQRATHRSSPLPFTLSPSSELERSLRGDVLAAPQSNFVEAAGPARAEVLKQTTRVHSVVPGRIPRPTEGAAPGPNGPPVAIPTVPNSPASFMWALPESAPRVQSGRTLSAAGLADPLSEMALPASPASVVRAYSASNAPLVTVVPEGPADRLIAPATVARPSQRPTELAAIAASAVPAPTVNYAAVAVETPAPTQLTQRTPALEFTSVDAPQSVSPESDPSDPSDMSDMSDQAPESIKLVSPRPSPDLARTADRSMMSEPSRTSTAAAAPVQVEPPLAAPQTETNVRPLRVKSDFTAQPEASIPTKPLPPTDPLNDAPDAAAPTLRRTPVSPAAPDGSMQREVSRPHQATPPTRESVVAEPRPPQASSAERLASSAQPMPSALSSPRAYQKPSPEMPPPVSAHSHQANPLPETRTEGSDAGSDPENSRSVPTSPRDRAAAEQPISMRPAMGRTPFRSTDSTGLPGKEVEFVAQPIPPQRESRSEPAWQGRSLAPQVGNPPATSDSAAPIAPPAESVPTLGATIKRSVRDIATTEVAKTEVVKPEAVKPEAVKPEVVRAEVVKPEVVKPEVVKAEVVKPEVVRAEVVKPEIVKAEVVKAEVVKAEVVKAEVVKAEVVKPEVVKPEVVKPEVVKAQVTQGDLLRPIAWAPLSVSSVRELDRSEPEASRRSVDLQRLGNVDRTVAAEGEATSHQTPRGESSFAGRLGGSRRQRDFPPTTPPVLPPPNTRDWLLPAGSVEVPLAASSGGPSLKDNAKPGTAMPTTLGLSDQSRGARESNRIDRVLPLSLSPTFAGPNAAPVETRSAGPEASSPKREEAELVASSSESGSTRPRAAGQEQPVPRNQESDVRLPLQRQRLEERVDAAKQPGAAVEPVVHAADVGRVIPSSVTEPSASRGSKGMIPADSSSGSFGASASAHLVNSAGQGLQVSPVVRPLRKDAKEQARSGESVRVEAAGVPAWRGGEERGGGALAETLPSVSRKSTGEPVRPARPENAEENVSGAPTRGVGTFGAQQRPEMKRKPAKTESAELAASKLPARDEVPAGRTRMAAGISRVTGGSENDAAPAWPVSPARFQPSGTAESGDRFGDGVRLSAAGLRERLLEGVSREVTVMQRNGAESLSVVLRPDRDTELVLRLGRQDGLLEATLQCDRGDRVALGACWGQLQEALSQQNVRLLPMREGDVPVAMEASANLSGQDRGSDRGGESFTRREAPVEGQGFGANSESHSRSRGQAESQSERRQEREPVPPRPIAVTPPREQGKRGTVKTGAQWESWA